jgi:hypothetical protein
MEKMDFFYLIDYFGPPAEEGQGMWGFEATLDPLIGVKARDTEMIERVHTQLQGNARGLIERYGLDKFGSIENPYAFVEGSWL